MISAEVDLTPLAVAASSSRQRGEEVNKMHCQVDLLDGDRNHHQPTDQTIRITAYHLDPSVPRNHGQPADIL